MIEPNGEYYLHENGNLIYKPHGGVQQDSSFVKRLWSVREISGSPEAFAKFLNQAHKAGAKNSEVERLANHNRLYGFISNWKEVIFDGEEPKRIIND